MRAPAALVFPTPLAAAVWAHVDREAPHEACGLLLGLGHTVHAVRPCRNVEASPRRYQIDPVDHFAALRQARAADLSVVGAYHSHPHGAAMPSASDRATAFEAFVFVIAGGAPGLASQERLRAWVWSEEAFHELPIVDA